MSTLHLTDEEAQALKMVLSAMLLKKRTGVSGIMHGGRFVGMERILRGPAVTALQGAMAKCGVVLQRYDG